MVLGRLPGKLRCFASVSASRSRAAVGAFSFKASAADLPRIRACDCARPLANSLACRSGSEWDGAAAVLDRLDEAELAEVPAGWREGALVQHLEIGMLAIGSRFAPHHRAGAEGQRLAGGVDTLSVTLHLELLEVGRKAL